MVKSEYKNSSLVVSLLVRLWVEMSTTDAHKTNICCQPPCEAVSWNAYHEIWTTTKKVSLLVRLWVEIPWTLPTDAGHPRQPPCEAVSWNVSPHNCNSTPAMSASLWGCELKYAFEIWNHISRLSASLWGCELKCAKKEPVNTDSLSASLWGCELKYLVCYCMFTR